MAKIRYQPRCTGPPLMMIGNLFVTAQVEIVCCGSAAVAASSLVTIRVSSYLSTAYINDACRATSLSKKQNTSSLHQSEQS